MNQRLQQFIAAENISQAQFADTIDVARASVSHVLAGRNKPGYDFIKNISDHYPKLNIEWLITGKGKMYKLDSPETPTPRNENVKLFEDDLFAPREPEIAHTVEKAEPKTAPIIESETSYSANQTLSNQRSISRIIVFYDDNTYQELK